MRGDHGQQRDSLLRLFAPAPAVPRHLSDPEPRGLEIAGTLDSWAGVGWVEDGPVPDPLAAVEDGLDGA